MIKENDVNGWRWYVGEEGKRYISVTTILDVAQPKYLTDWFKRTSKKEIEKKQKTSRDHGTAIHTAIEKQVKGLEHKIDPEHVKHLDNWKKLRDKHRITGQEAEKVVVSDVWGYAGTVDLVGLYEEQLSVMDVKTGRSYSIKTGWQMAAYKQALEEKGYPKLGMAGLHVPSDGKEPRSFKYTHYDWCWNRFLDCLGAFKGLYFTALSNVEWPWLHVERQWQFDEKLKGDK